MADRFSPSTSLKQRNLRFVSVRLLEMQHTARRPRLDPAVFGQRCSLLGRNLDKEYGHAMCHLVASL